MYLILNEIFDYPIVKFFTYGYWIIIIYFVGLLGIILNARNFIISMLNLELTYVSLIILFTLESTLYNNTIEGWVMALLLIVIAACESAIGLGLLIIISKYEQTIDFVEFQKLKG